jgi:ubiquinone/menaquinone biosynthesis C-methylase UbiE
LRRPRGSVNAEKAAAATSEVDGRRHVVSAIKILTSPILAKADAAERICQLSPCSIGFSRLNEGAGNLGETTLNRNRPRFFQRCADMPDGTGLGVRKGFESISMAWNIKNTSRMATDFSVDDSVIANGSRSLVALSKFNAIRYFDALGKLAHSYNLPGDYVLADYTKHYFRFLENGPAAARAYSLKFNFTQTILNLIRAIEGTRTSCSVLDIGSTIGETYYILFQLLALERSRTRLEFVGLDMNSNCVSFARDLFARDPNFQSVTGEASDLSRFPDESFDFVVSNAVLNHTVDQAASVREAVRVARVATVLQLMMSSSGETQRFRHTAKRDAEYYYEAPTPKRLFSILPESDRYTWYLPTRGTKMGVKLDDDRYLDAADPSKLEWQMVIIAKHPILTGAGR